MAETTVVQKMSEEGGEERFISLFSQDWKDEDRSLPVMNPSHLYSSCVILPVNFPARFFPPVSHLSWNRLKIANELFGMRRVRKSLSVLEFCFIVKHDGKLLYGVD